METRKKYWLHGHFEEVGTCRRNWNKKFRCKDGFNLKCFRAEPRQTPLASLELRTQTPSVLIRCCFHKISISWNLLFLLRNQNCWGKLGTCVWNDWLLFSGVKTPKHWEFAIFLAFLAAKPLLKETPQGVDKLVICVISAVAKIL